MYGVFNQATPLKVSKDLFDDLATLEHNTPASLVLDDDEVLVIPQDFYLEVKACQAQDKYGIIDAESQG